ncbi:MAG: DUF1365 family protein, partial [Desulfobacteraceae bacterium]|nr:DUF1365 family protein [Desulfobacteraceae bacterium]
MFSRIYPALVVHERYHPVRHRLLYKIYVYGFDLSELADLDRRLPLFGHNRPRPVSLYDADHLDPTPGTIRDKLLKRLTAHGVPVEDIDRIVMVTSPRFLGHVFNPASFYFCLAASGRLLAVMAEVNNTYGEKHLYPLLAPTPEGLSFPARFQVDKAFHVSPFNTMEGEYRFRFGDIGHALNVRIDLHRDGVHIMQARLKGKGLEMTTTNQLRVLRRHPITPWLTLARIYRQAFVLYFKRKLAFHDKPVPLSPMTVRRLPPTSLQRFCMKRILGHLAKAVAGRLEVVLPDGTIRLFGPQNNEPAARIQVNDYRFFSRVALGADIGLGEAFMVDEWDTDDVAAVIAFFIRNRKTFKDGNFAESVFMGIL